MAGETAATAEVLAFDTSEAFSLSGSPDGEVWYRLQPSVTGSYRFVMDGVSAAKPYCDVYRDGGQTLSPFGYNNWVGWCGDNGTDHEESCIELVAGQEYLVACYDWVGFGVSSNSFTIEVQADVGPANDRVVNATLLDSGAVQVIGSTAGGSEEEDEFNIWGGSQCPSVWYKVIIGGPGNFTYGIESNTPGFHPHIELFHAAGAVTGFNDLDQDISAEQVGDGTETPPSRVYDQVGTPGSTAGDLAPLEGGEVFYLMVTSHDQQDAGDFGSFTLSVTTPPEALCLDAVDYMSGSGTVSNVSGAVRETQVYNGGFATASVGYESFLTDMTPTLVIPGNDILNGAGAGFYAVSVKTKLGTSADALGGMFRNGQVLYPGALLDSTTGSTPVMGWLTLAAGTDVTQETLGDNVTSGFVQSLNQVWYLPVAPGDEIKVIIVGGTEGNGPSTIDITQICFQRIQDATTGQPYALLDVPEFPLGMVASDATAAVTKQGPFAALLGSTTAPTYNNHDIEGMDICFTDDGTLWVVLNMEAFTTSGTRYIGPALLKWNGSAWSLINNDIEGLGVKRTTRGGFSGSGAPYGICMDTDGEDLWIAYGVDDGLGPGSFRNTALRVKKYDVSANSFSNVGGVVQANTTKISVRSEVGAFESSAQIKLAPNGDVWVAFTDWYDEGVLSTDVEPLLFDTPRPAYAAKFNGSSWNVQRLPPPEWWMGDRSDALADTQTYEAENVMGGGSGTSTTFLSQSCVSVTQTTFAADTFQFTPPAGKYGIQMRVAGNTTGMNHAVRVRIDGVDTYSASDDITGSITNQWLWNSRSDFYIEVDGSQQVELSVRKSGATGTTVYIDKIWLVPAWVVVQNRPNSWGPWYTTFVEDAQFHVQLAFDGSNNPVAIYQTATLRYTEDDTALAFNTTDPWNVGYVPPNTHWANYAYLFQVFVYSRFNGTTWTRLWQNISDRDIPNYVSVKTPYEPFGGPTPIGHWQQGMALHSDGTDVWCAACLGLDINGGAEFVLFKCGEAGMEYVGERPPGILGGNGYGDFDYSWLQWMWDINPKSIAKTADGLFVCFPASGPVNNGEDLVGVYAPNGIGDWFHAVDGGNMPLGYAALDAALSIIVPNPAGTKLYLATVVYKGDLVGIPDPDTSGVWELDIIPEAKIPLIPLPPGGATNMNWREGFRGDVNRVLV